MPQYGLESVQLLGVPSWFRISFNCCCKCWLHPLLRAKCSHSTENGPHWLEGIGQSLCVELSQCFWFPWREDGFPQAAVWFQSCITGLHFSKVPKHRLICALPFPWGMYPQLVKPHTFMGSLYHPLKAEVHSFSPMLRASDGKAGLKKKKMSREWFMCCVI